MTSGEQPCGEGAQGHEPQNGNLKLGVEDGRRIGSHGIEGGVAQVEEAGMSHDEVQTEAENGVQPILLSTSTQ